MAGRGMFGRLSSAFQGDNKKKEESHADIIEELKAEVKAIQETERESVVRAGVGWERRTCLYHQSRTDV